MGSEMCIRDRHKGSLYGSFKSKENLFFMCLDHYVAGKSEDFLNSGLQAKSYLRTFFLSKLNASVERKAKGCLLMNVCVELAPLKGRASLKKVNRLLEGTQKNFECAVQSGVLSGELSKKIDVKKTSERLLALAFTMEEMGKIGKSKAFLRNIANGTLQDLNIKI